jgi:menaquinone-dependent protoporphyrinogen oxidase
MNVLVTYATRHGATAGIASRIADSLSAAGHDAHAVPVEDVTDIGGYDAVVLGSAAYMFHWLKPAVRFARHHHAELAARPVWLFSSGPIGTDQVDAQGQDVRISTRPKEWDEVVPLLSPRGEAVFFGAYDPAAPAIGLGEKLMRYMPAAAKTLPAGDFRDWDAIESWATEIATALDGTVA